MITPFDYTQAFFTFGLVVFSFLIGYGICFFKHYNPFNDATIFEVEENDREE